MKFDCSRDQLIQAIGLAQRCVANKSTITVLQGILFQATEDQLFLTANNNEIAIRTIIPANVREPGEIILTASLITEVIRKLGGDTVYFETENPYQIKVECQLSSFHLKGFSTEEFPQFPMIQEEYDFSVDAEQFKIMLQRSIFAVATNDNIPILTGVKMEIFDDIIRLISIDGYRMALCQDTLDKGIGENIDVIIPGKSLQELDRILSGKTGSLTIRFSETQIFFELENILFTSRLLQGEFINYRSILPEKYYTAAIVNRSELLQSSDRAALVAKVGKNNLIKMDFKADHLELFSSADVGEVHEVLPITLEGEELRIAFNDRFVVEALRAVPDDQVLIKLTHSVGPAVMIPVDENESYTYMILPIRLAE